MYCTNCGSPVSQGDRFCTNCGADLRVQEVASTEPESPVGEQQDFSAATPDVASSVSGTAAPTMAQAKPRRHGLVIGLSVASAVVLVIAVVLSLIATNVIPNPLVRERAVTFAIKAPHYNEKTDSKIPLHITGRTSSGRVISQHVYVSPKAPVVHLAPGQYTVQVEASPLLSSGDVYRIPEPIKIDTTKGSGLALKPQPVKQNLEFETKPANEVTIQDIQLAERFAKKSNFNDHDISIIHTNLPRKKVAQAYNKVLDQLDTSTYSSYSLHDLNGDGIPELLVRHQIAAYPAVHLESDDDSDEDLEQFLDDSDDDSDEDFYDDSDDESDDDSTNPQATTLSVWTMTDKQDIPTQISGTIPIFYGYNEKFTSEEYEVSGKGMYTSDESGDYSWGSVYTFANNNFVTNDQMYERNQQDQYESINYLPLRQRDLINIYGMSRVTSLSQSAGSLSPDQLTVLSDSAARGKLPVVGMLRRYNSQQLVENANKKNAHLKVDQRFLNSGERKMVRDYLELDDPRIDIPLNDGLRNTKTLDYSSRLYLSIEGEGFSEPSVKKLSGKHVILVGNWFGFENTDPTPISQPWIHVDTVIALKD